MICTALEVMDCVGVDVKDWVEVWKAVWDALYLFVNGLVPRRICQPDATGSCWNVLYMSYARIRERETQKSSASKTNTRLCAKQSSPGMCNNKNKNIRARGNKGGRTGRISMREIYPSITFVFQYV